MESPPPSIARLLAHRAPLGAWYGNPLDGQEAVALERTTTRREAACRLRGRECTGCQLQRLIARHWQGMDIQPDYEQLAAHYRQRHSRRALALLELITGQLLMAGRQSAAIGHLQRGFELARTLFAPADYFTVLNRHQLLAQLPASDDTPPSPLTDLLTTAAVMVRLDDPHRRRRIFSSDPTDLYG